MQTYIFTYIYICIYILGKLHQQFVLQSLAFAVHVGDFCVQVLDFCSNNCPKLCVQNVSFVYITIVHFHLPSNCHQNRFCRVH